MPALVKMAFRNLVAHRTKSLIVGSIVALGAVILVVALSFMGSARRGLEQSFVRDFTGQVMISGKAEGTLSLFGVQSMGGTEGTPVIPRIDAVLSYVRSQPDVQRFTTQLSGACQVNVEQNDMQDATSLLFLFGVEPEGYHTMFDNLDLVSGSYLRPGEQGILLSASQVENLNQELRASIRVGEPVILQNFGTAIRAVTVRGIFTFRRPQSALDSVSYVDARTLRSLEGITPGDTQGEAGAEPWHFILVDLKNPKDTQGFIERTNSWLSQQGIEARASGWQRAAGPFSAIPSVIGMLFIAALFIVAVVAVIIIMNTLVASVIERTSEIGTMRALGAGKLLVWRMFFLETIVLCGVFGLLGIGIGAGALGILGLTGIPATNSIMRLVAGASIFRPAVSLSAVVTSLAAILVIGIVAHLYPVAVALRVQPVRAIHAGQNS